MPPSWCCATVLRLGISQKLTRKRSKNHRFLQLFSCIECDTMTPSPLQNVFQLNQSAYWRYRLNSSWPGTVEQIALRYKLFVERSVINQLPGAERNEQINWLRYGQHSTRNRWNPDGIEPRHVNFSSRITRARQRSVVIVAARGLFMSVATTFL